MCVLSMGTRRGSQLEVQVVWKFHPGKVQAFSRILADSFFSIAGIDKYDDDNVRANSNVITANADYGSFYDQT